MDETTHIRPERTTERTTEPDLLSRGEWFVDNGNEVLFFDTKEAAQRHADRCMADDDRPMDAARWIDRADHTLINKALTEAHEAFDRTYYESVAVGDLRANAADVIAALKTVLTLTEEESDE